MNQSEVIAFLVGCKFPLLKALTASRSISSNPVTSEKWDDMAKEAARYRRHLEELSAEQLRTLRGLELEQQERERRAQAEQAEAARFFNLSSADADFEFWCKAAYWTLDEAVLLTLGKDPHVVTAKAIAPFRVTSAFVRQFDKLRNLAGRALWAGALFDPVLPSIYANWAFEHEIPLPDPILTRVLRGKPVRSVLEKTNAMQAELIELLQKNLASKEERLEEAAAKAASLAQDLQDVMALKVEDPSAKPSSTVERDNMLKVIWAIAVDAYGHGPDLKRTRAIADIRNALQLQGLELSDDTIRRYLAAARDRLHDWENKDS